MAATTATAYCRPWARAALSGNGVTGAFAYIAVRSLVGVWSQAGVAPLVDRKNLKTPLPSPRQPIAYVEIDGKRYPAYVDAQSWFRWMTYLQEIQLGGTNAPTVKDIEASVQTTLEQASASAQTAAAVAQQSQATADTLSAAVRVIRKAELIGAEDIPL